MTAPSFPTIEGYEVSEGLGLLLLDTGERLPIWDGDTLGLYLLEGHAVSLVLFPAHLQMIVPPDMVMPLLEDLGFSPLSIRACFPDFAAFLTSYRAAHPDWPLP